MEYINAFVFGGIICAFSQILMEKTKLMPGRIMVILVCLGAVLHFFGLFEPIQEIAGAGITVPLLGFGKILMEGVFKGIQEKGFIGLFTGGLTASAAGITAALIFSYLSSFIFSSKMKR